MGLASDLESEVKKIFRSAWETREGEVVPEPDDIGLGNEGVYLDAAVLYADLDGSTKMVDSHAAEFAAEIYKTYLYCAGRVIASEDGAITAYDGDRVMAVFIGDARRTRAVRTAMKINYIRTEIINPAIKSQYPQKGFSIDHGIGVDASRLLVARTGVRGANDLVWVGRAANYAAKLSDLGQNYTRITKDVYDCMNDCVKTSSDGRNMWDARTWTTNRGDIAIYRSGWTWTVS